MPSAPRPEDHPKKTYDVELHIFHIHDPAPAYGDVFGTVTLAE